MGADPPVNLLEYRAQRIDLFDRVTPMRNGHNGQLFPTDSIITVTYAQWT